MPAPPGEPDYPSLTQALEQARAAPQSWQPLAAPAFLIVLAPGTKGGLEGEGEELPTRASLDPTEATMPGLKAWLVPLDRGRYSTDQKRVVLGRSSVCDVILPFPALSKVHAYFSEGPPGVWHLEDAGSRNLTFLNGVEVNPGTRFALTDGAEVKFGDVEATFWLRESLAAEIKRQASARR